MYIKNKDTEWSKYKSYLVMYHVNNYGIIFYI